MASLVRFLLNYQSWKSEKGVFNVNIISFYRLEYLTINSVLGLYISKRLIFNTMGILIFDSIFLVVIIPE
jgi:hypothetical protein